MTEAVDTVPPPVPPVPSHKVDPEALALRAQPVRAVRFKRGAIIGMAAAASAGIVGIAWVALQPSALHIATSADEDAPMPSNQSADAVASLPASYSDVSKLGPPLPGDLGRPILRHQQQAVATLPAVEGDDINRAAFEERDRRMAERKAALESPVLVRSSPSTPAAPSSPAPPSLSSASETTDRVAIDPQHDPGVQQRKADFIATAAALGVSVHRIEKAASPYILSAGSVIAASLITGLRSDLPGLVTAQVTERVFDSATGQVLLVPQGARLIGSYDSVVAFGQRRALIVWQRLILPDGSALQLDNVPAADPSGYAGLADQVDFHSWSLLKGAAISTLLGVGANLTFSGESDLVQAVRESTQQNVSRAGDQLVSRNLSIQPTITIRPGAAVRLVVHRDSSCNPGSNRRTYHVRSQADQAS